MQGILWSMHGYVCNFVDKIDINRNWTERQDIMAAVLNHYTDL